MFKTWDIFWTMQKYPNVFHTANGPTPTYEVDLLTVLLLSNLCGAFFVLVGLHDLILEILELVGLGTDALDFFFLSLVEDFHVGHLSGQVVFNSGCGVEITSGTELGGCHNGRLI